MNKKIIWYSIGRMLLVESCLLILPLLISVLYQEDMRYILSYLGVIALTFVLGAALSVRKLDGTILRARDGAVAVALGWILLAFFGGLPFVFSGDIPSVVDAFFETASGFTTTGSSILTTLAPLSHSNLFWRSFTHLIGGMGFLVFTLAVLPGAKSDAVHLMRAEVPGPVFGKVMAKISDTSRVLYAIYLCMVAVFIVILLFGGVPLFDASLLAFGTAGTGGFAIHDKGFAIYSNPVFVEYAIAIGMLVFGINFNLFFLVLMGQVKEFFKDEELKWYLGIAGGAVVLIVLSLWDMQSSIEPIFRNVLFTVSSVMTTTGYATADFAQWSIFAQLILVALMFIGGCAGSTAGGIKVSRIAMYVKEAFSEMFRLGHTNRVVMTTFNKKPLQQKDSMKIARYLQVYVLVFVVFVGIVSIESPDFSTAITSVAATFNNIGPGLSAVGPTRNFAFYSDFMKIVLSMSMIAGRLEIYPMIILFAPSTLKKLTWRS